MNTKIKISIALLMFSAVLIFNTAQTFHHHEHIEDELKCQICILSTSVDFQESATQITDKIFAHGFLLYPENATPFIQNYQTSNNPLRAPPAYL